MFICQVQGDPVPTVVWFKDSEPVNQSKFIDITDYTLKIKYLRDEDSGVYTCEGGNRGGTVTRQLTLEVTGTIDIPAVIGENYYHCTDTLIHGVKLKMSLLGGSITAGVFLVAVIVYLVYRICYYQDQIR